MATIIGFLHMGCTWRIRLNRPYEAVMRPYVKLLWPLAMAALRSRCGHYIFALWFLSSFYLFYSSPNLSGRRLDVYHTATHDVALGRI